MNKIQGKILVKETSVGIPNLVVVIYDLDERYEPIESYKDHTQEPQPVNINYYWAKINGNRLGSVITDANGEFELSYEDDEFIVEKKENRPDLILYVLAPEEEEEARPNNLNTNADDAKPKILFESRAIRANAGKIESYLIKISKNRLAGLGVPTNNSLIDLNEKKGNIITGIQDAFDLNNTIKKTQDDATKDKLKLATAARQKAKQKFHPLILSTVKPEIRNKPTYFHANDNLKKKHTEIINRALEKFTNRSNKEKKRPFLTIKTKEGDGQSLPKDVNEIIQYIMDNPNGVSIERVSSPFPKDYSAIVADYISEIITTSKNINPSPNA